MAQAQALSTQQKAAAAGGVVGAAIYLRSSQARGKHPALDQVDEDLEELSPFPGLHKDLAREK